VSVSPVGGEGAAGCGVTGPGSRDEVENGDRPAAAWAGVVAAAAPLALGAAGIVLSLSLGIGTFTDPAPGLWPLLIGAALVVVSVVLVAKKQSRDGCERFTAGVLMGVGAAVSLTVLALLFEQTGFELPTLGLLAFWLRIIGRESLLVTALVSVGTTAALYVVFIVALGVPIPHLIAL
jgi:putative tricarboxylic transport membrane protein